MSKRPRHIFTFGYSGASLAQLTRLSRGLDATVIDTRYSRLTRRVDFSANRLGSALKERYVHVPEFGNLNYKNGRAVKLADPVLGISRVSSIISQRSVILLCVCASPEQCHRQDVAELLSGEFALPVKHLRVTISWRGPTLWRARRWVKRPVTVVWSVVMSRRRAEVQNGE